MGYKEGDLGSRVGAHTFSNISQDEATPCQREELGITWSGYKLPVVSIMFGGSEDTGLR